MANQIIYPYGTEGVLPSNIGLVDDLLTGGADKALTAEQGRYIGEKITSRTVISVNTTKDGYILPAGTFSSNASFKTNVYDVSNQTELLLEMSEFEEPTGASWFRYAFWTATSGTSSIGSAVTIHSKGKYQIIVPANAKYLAILTVVTVDGVQYGSTSNASVKSIKWINEALPQAFNWSNLTWLLIGDSLTEENYRANSHYFDYIAEKTGISFINKGKSGKGYANDDYFYSVIHNLSNTNFSFATIFGSGNDIRYEAFPTLSSASSWDAALGDIDDNGTMSICGYINRAIDEYYSKAPLKKLAIITPTPWKNGSAQNVQLTNEETERRMRTYSEKLVLIAKKRGIPCLDLFSCSGLRPWDESFRVEYYNEDGVQDGGVHPNSKGHKWIANMFLVFLLQFIVE